MQLRDYGRALLNQRLLHIFMLSTDAAGAKIETFPLAINHNNSRVDIGFPPTIGMTFGMTDSITELRRFTANITLQNRFSLTNLGIYSILYYHTLPNLTRVAMRVFQGTELCLPVKIRKYELLNYPLVNN